MSAFGVLAILLPKITSLDVSDFHHNVDKMKHPSRFLSCNFISFSISVNQVRELQIILSLLSKKRFHHMSCFSMELKENVVACIQ